MRFRPPLSFQACALRVLLAVFFFGISWPLSSTAQDQQTSVNSLDEKQILHHLNNVITWYRKTKTQIQPVGLPTDALYQATASRLAGDVVTLAFASAEKAAPLLPTENTPAAGSSRQTLVKLLGDTTVRNAQLQAQISQLNSQIASAPRRKVQALVDKRDQLQGELDLGNSMITSLSQLTKISEQRSQNKKNAKDTGTEASTNGFEASVAQLKSSLPEIFDPKSQQPGAPPAAQNISTSTGLIGQLRRLYDQSLSLHELDNLQIETAQLQDFVNSMRAPLRAQIRATVEQGRALSTRVDNPANQPVPTKQEFDALASQFDQISAVSVPLSQEVLALDESKANFLEWRSSIRREYGIILRGILVRVGIVVGVLGLLLLISDLWKRMTFRYIADTRRRRQFLLVRRFVIGFLIGLVLIFSFVTEFSALATFAGFLTAGIAVGLQTVLLSVAAYFFLIGRYGIRVGDRISVAGVTGDVVDVGFVRFYLLELAGTGIDLQPTGRIVAFANAVLFQPGVPMYRQLPGTDYAWHEISIALQPSGNHKLVEDTMMQIIQSVYEKYQPILDRQQRSIEQRFEVPFSRLAPKVQLQLADTGLEAVVRYPVSLRHSVEADDEITRRLLELIGKSEELRAVVAGLPRIRAAIRG